MPNKARLQVVIVSYNVRYYAAQAIKSVLRAASQLQLEIWVVDNASSDDSVEYLRSRFPEVRYIANNENTGFSRANNMAIRQSDTDYVLLLNPDTIVAEDTLPNCVTFMDSHPNVGAVGTRMQDVTGTFARESRRALPTPWVSMLKMAGFSRHYYMSHLSLDEQGEIEVISGAFMMLRRSALEKTGLLDERFFMYGEDIDLSYRMTEAGYHNYYLPYPIMHYKGESTHKSSFRYVHVFYDAMLIFYNKHFASRYRLLTSVIRMAVVSRGVVDYISQKMHCLHSKLHPYRREDEIYLLQASKEHTDDIIAVLKANRLPYDTTPQSGRQYTYLLIDDSHSYSHILSESRKHQKLILAIYSCEDKHIITHCDVFSAQA